jgi:hypothetical protein
MAEPDPSPAAPLLQSASTTGPVRRLFPWSEGQAKLALAVVAAVVVAGVAGAIIFGINLHE